MDTNTIQTPNTRQSRLSRLIGKLADIYNIATSTTPEDLHPRVAARSHEYRARVFLAKALDPANAGLDSMRYLNDALGEMTMSLDYSWNVGNAGTGRFSFVTTMEEAGAGLGLSPEAITQLHTRNDFISARQKYDEARRLAATDPLQAIALLDDSRAYVERATGRPLYGYFISDPYFGPSLQKELSAAIGVPETGYVATVQTARKHRDENPDGSCEHASPAPSFSP
jgi:hypothetical protein